MALIFPADTNKLRNLEERFSYFVVIKSATRLLTNLPLKEYFIYKYIVPVTEKRGKNEILQHFEGDFIDKIYPINDTEYSTGKFSHPRYTTRSDVNLSIPYKEIPIYTQTNICKVEIKGSMPSMGSNPPSNII